MAPIAIFGNIHANLPALEAVLADMDARHLTERYCLGDLVGYCVWPNEVIATLAAAGTPTIMGNYDRGVSQDSDDCGCAYRDAAAEALGKRSIAWSNAQTGAEGLAIIKRASVRGILQATLTGGTLMDLTGSLKTLLIETAKSLKGRDRRLFMARTVAELGPGGQARAARELHWGRMTIRTGLHELASGLRCADAFAVRGRKRAEAHLPHLLADLQAIVDSPSQTDPQFRTNRLYTRLTAAEVRRQLIAQKGYSDEQLPTAATIGSKLNALGYYPQKVAKTQPPKKSRKPTPSSRR